MIRNHKEVVRRQKENKKLVKYLRKRGYKAIKRQGIVYKLTVKGKEINELV